MFSPQPQVPIGGALPPLFPDLDAALHAITFREDDDRIKSTTPPHLPVVLEASVVPPASARETAASERNSRKRSRDAATYDVMTPSSPSRARAKHVVARTEPNERPPPRFAQMLWEMLRHKHGVRWHTPRVIALNVSEFMEHMPRYCKAKHFASIMRQMSHYDIACKRDVRNRQAHVLLLTHPLFCQSQRTPPLLRRRPCSLSQKRWRRAH